LKSRNRTKKKTRATARKLAIPVLWAPPRIVFRTRQTDNKNKFIANEIYRTYEVLIEESVHPDAPKRGKTNKADAQGRRASRRLSHQRTVSSTQVCYYTIMLAGLAVRRRRKAPFAEFHSGKNSRKVNSNNKLNMVQRFAGRYTTCADLGDL